MPPLRRTASAASQPASIAPNFVSGARTPVVGLRAWLPLDLVDDHELARDLVSGEARAQESLELVERRRARIAPLHHGDDALAPPLVGNTDDDGVEDAGVLLQCALHLF